MTRPDAGVFIRRDETVGVKYLHTVSEQTEKGGKWKTDSKCRWKGCGDHVYILFYSIPESYKIKEQGDEAF